jgi:hypothetical protein
LKHGVALWQEFYHANVCDRVVSEGTNILHDQKSFILILAAFQDLGSCRSWNVE